MGRKLTLLVNMRSSKAIGRTRKNILTTLKRTCGHHFAPLGFEVEVREMDFLDTILFNEYDIDTESELYEGEQVFWLVYDNEQPLKYVTNEAIDLDGATRSELARTFLPRKYRRVAMSVYLDQLNML